LFIENQTNSIVNRIVFTHYRNNFGRTVYKFTGVFETSKTESTAYMKVHKLVSKSYKIIVA